MELYTLEQVKALLKEQRHICQVERNKRSHLEIVDDISNWYIHTDDILNAEEPVMFLDSEFISLKNMNLARKITFLKLDSFSTDELLKFVEQK